MRDRTLAPAGESRTYTRSKGGTDQALKPEQSGGSKIHVEHNIKMCEYRHISSFKMKYC